MSRLIFYYFLIDVCFQSSLSSKERKQLQEDLGRAQAQLAGGSAAHSVSEY